MIHVHAWQSLRQTFPIRKSEWALAFLTLGIAILLAVRPTLFQEQDSYDGMARLFSQQVWQWLCFVVGAGRITVLFVNGAYWRTPHARAVLAFLNAGIWLQIAIGVAQNVGIGMLVFPTLVLLDIFNFKQAFTEAGISEGLRDAERSRVPAHS